MKIKSWIGEAVLIIAALCIAALVVLGAVDKISRRIDAQLKDRAVAAEAQR